MTLVLDQVQEVCLCVLVVLQVVCELLHFFYFSKIGLLVIV